MSQKSTQIISVLFATFLASTLLAGCNLAPPPAKTSPAKKQPSKVPVEKAKVEFPSAWPKEVPVYPQAELESATSTADGMTLVFKTEDTAPQIFEWYYDKLEAGQWTMKGPTLDVAQNFAIIKAQLTNEILVMEARNPESNGGGTQLTLTSGPPQPAQ